MSTKKTGIPFSDVKTSSLKRPSREENESWESAGAQLIAKALGAKVCKAPVKEIGWYEVSLTEEGEKDPLFFDFPKNFSVFQWHEDTFDLPNGGKGITTSTKVIHQAFRYGENAYGLQFHLEVTEKMIRNWIDEYEAGKTDILVETERYLAAYRERGKRFFNRFFNL